MQLVERTSLRDGALPAVEQAAGLHVNPVLRDQLEAWAKNLREVMGIDLSKRQQLSDWGADALSDAQVAYAASDVLNLHALKDKLDAMLIREGRQDLAAACFRFLPDRVRLDLAGWAAEDVFAHS